MLRILEKLIMSRENARYVIEKQFQNCQYNVIKIVNILIN